jgi:hypothetical protein
MLMHHAHDIGTAILYLLQTLFLQMQQILEVEENSVVIFSFLMITDIKNIEVILNNLESFQLRHQILTENACKIVILLFNEVRIVI